MFNACPGMRPDIRLPRWYKTSQSAGLSAGGGTNRYLGNAQMQSTWTIMGLPLYGSWCGSWFRTSSLLDLSLSKPWMLKCLEEKLGLCPWRRDSIYSAAARLINCLCSHTAFRIIWQPSRLNIFPNAFLHPGRRVWGQMIVVYTKNPFPSQCSKRHWRFRFT